MAASIAPALAGLPPVPRTPLIGRDAERAVACSLLLDDDAPLLVLTGPGGVGKTRLAIAVAHDAAPRFADGVAFVDLAPLADPALVPAAVASAVGVSLAAETPVGEALVVALREQHRLLVLDNCEHVLAAAADLVAALLAACPGLRVLATSRVALHLRDEQVLPVSPLATPPEGAALDDVAAAPGVALFVQRARAADARFALTPANAADVAAICRRLDGLPLAIELAAARSRLLSPAEMLAMLGERLPALAGAPRDAPRRHRTLQDAISWSYDLLAPRDRACFCALAVFVGGWTLDAAAAVCELPLPDALDVLESLADQNLVVRASAPDAAHPRFAMLETIRAFALECLAASGEETVMRRRHAARTAEFVTANGGPSLWRRADLEPALRRIDADLDNIRAALAWAVGHGEDLPLIDIAVALEAYWFYRGGLVEGRSWIDRAHHAAEIGDVGLHRRAVTRLSAGWLARLQGDTARAEELALACLPPLRELGDVAHVADALELLGFTTEDQEDFHLAQALHLESLALYLTLDFPAQVANTKRHVGWTSFLVGDFAGAERWLWDAVTESRRLGVDQIAAVALSDLASIAVERGEHRRAAELLQERLGQTADAWGVLHSLEQLAEVAAACGESEPAARLFGAAEAYRGRIGAPMVQSLVTINAPYVAAARTALGKTRFAAAWAAGRRLSLDDARAEAALVARPPVRADTGAESAGAAGHVLTPRELEVLRLLVEGRSDREIAEALFISYRTTTSHVGNILAKLDAASRTAAASYAIRHGLV